MALPSGYQLVTELPTINTFTNVEIQFTTTLIHSVFKTYLGKRIPSTRVNHLGAANVRCVERFNILQSATNVMVNNSSVPNKFTCNVATSTYFCKRMLWIIPLIVWHRFNKSDIRVSQT